jgi:hypothetical protein
MICRFVHLALFIATLTQIATCFTTVRPLSLLSLSPAITTIRFATNNDDGTTTPADSDNETPASDEVSAPVASQPAPPVKPSMIPQQQQQQPRDRRMDPLLATLTRTDPSADTSKTVKAPLFGEVAIDGSLVVLVPAIVLGLAGFVMSFNIALNSQDAIVDSLSQLSNQVTAAAVAKTNNLAPIDGSSCRGICSTQETDLESLKTFMQGFSNK